MNSPSQSPIRLASNFRWVICALLFFSTTNNYMDRQVIGYLKDIFLRAGGKGRFWLDEHGFLEPDFIFHRRLCGLHAGCGLDH